MNVRMDPLNQGGILTATGTVVHPDYFGSAGPTGSNNQTYVQDKFYQFNAYKGQKDFRSADLGIAKRQMEKNPFAHPLA